MKLRDRAQRGYLISLVPLVDVMTVLLMFLMVTSTYLDLDMVPVVDRADAPDPGPTAFPGQRGTALLVRLGPDGRAYLRGQALEPVALADAIQARLVEAGDAPVLVLPSGQANLQALVAVMETATRAGATSLRVIRLEAGS